jgi:ATP-dependent Zn protease
MEIRNNCDYESKAISSEQEIENIEFKPDEIAEDVLSNKLKTKNNNLIIQDSNIHQNSEIKNQKQQKSFWEKLYIAGVSVMFALACFVVCLFILTFSFLFHRHMMQIASDPIRLESFLGNIWMGFSGGAIFLFFYFATYFVKRNYRKTDKEFNQE